MSNEQFSPGSNSPARRGGLKTAVVLVAAAAAAAAAVAGGVYALPKLPKLVKRLEQKKVAAEVAAMVAKLDRPDTSSAAKDDDHAAIKATVNRLLPDVSFTDLAGKAGSLKDYRANILVISMTSADCPISKKLLPALTRLPEEFKDGRVQFLLVNTEKAAKRDVLENHSRQLPGWRYVHDPDAHLGRMLAARTTTEAFVIDEARTLRYRGAVDGRFEIGMTRSEAGSHFLREAIGAVREHQPLVVQLTAAPGCLLGLDPAEVTATPITWHNQISRFTQYNCVECHRRGAVAPFSLETYDRVTAKKAMIEKVLVEKIMPPWFADHAYGKWRNTREISDADRKMFSDWVAAGTPEGAPAEAPVAIKRSSGWSIRDPDLVIDVKPQQIPAEGYLEWKKFPVSFTVTQDLWVAEAEIHPSAPEVVHHAMLFVEFPEDDPRRQAQTRAESEDSGGADGFWLSYFPGRSALVLPPGRGKLIPRNGKIFLQMHYVPNGTAVVDKTKIGFKLLPAPPEKAVVTSSVIKWDFVIEPNATAEYTTSEVFQEDVRLLCLMPHMHYRGVGAQVFLKPPGGEWETLLNVPKFDPEWQFAYEFREPLLVTKGTRMAIRHEYDNTTKNKRNPSPMARVRHGNKTTNDMMINFFDWEPAGDPLPPSGKAKRRPFE